MATMRINNVNCNVVFIDPGASGSNNGTTPTDALTALPGPSTWVSNTVYLIRRGTSNLTMSSGTITAANIYCFGMPKSTDIFYDVAPASAKAAWDSDVDDYANVASSSGAGLSSTSSFIGLFGIYFRITSHTTFYNLINFSSIDSYNIFMIFCKIKDPTYDLDTTSSTSSTYVGNVRILGNNIVLDRIYIERQVASTATAISANFIYAIDVTGNNLYIGNVTLWYQTNGYSAYPGGPGGISINSDTYNNVTTENIDILLVQQSTTTFTGFGRILNILECNSLIVRNFNITFDRFVGSLPANTSSVLSAIYIYMDDEASCTIDGLTLDLSAATQDIFAGYYLDLDFNLYNAYRMPLESSAKNIMIIPVDPIYQTSSYKSNSIDIKGGSPLFLEDCNLDSGRHGIRLRAGATTEIGLRTQNLNISGPLIAENILYLDIDTYTKNTDEVIDAISLIGTNAHIVTANFPSTWGGNTSVALSNGCNVFIDNFNHEGLFYTSAGTSFRKSTLYVNNIGGIPGNWQAHNFLFHAETSAAFRTGGANASIRLYSTATSIDFANKLQIGKRPFPGLKLTPPSTGNRTLTVYIAYKLFTVPNNLLRYFVIKVNSPTGSSDYTEYNSSIVGDWQDDTSIWNNDEGLTIKKCEIPITVDRIDSVNVYIEYGWWEANNGYLYLDPAMSIT